MRSSTLCWLGALALAACAPAQPGEDRTAAPAPDTPVASDAPPAPPAHAGAIGRRELFGQWQLVSLTGADLAGNPPVYLLVGAARIEAVSQCIPFAFSIVDFAEGRVRIRGESWPDPVCERGRSPVEQLFPAVLTSARRIVRRPNGRIALVGTMGEAVIERPAEPPTNPFGNVPGPDPWLMWGEWQVASLDGAPAPGDAIRVNFYHRSVEAQSGCVSLFWRLQPSGAARLRLARAPPPGPICERSPTPAESALVAAFASELSIDAPSPVRRRLTSRDGSVLLRR